jgi:hypothetical protein
MVTGGGAANAKFPRLPDVAACARRDRRGRFCALFEAEKKKFLLPHLPSQLHAAVRKLLSLPEKPLLLPLIVPLDRWDIHVHKYI